MLATLHQAGLLTMILRSQIPNNSQWCLDWKGAYPGGEVTNPRGPSSGSDRVTRGGGWDYGASYLRSADRNASNSSPPGSSSNSHGFRVALSFSP